MPKIFQKDSPVLRSRAKPVLVKDIQTLRIKKIIRDMKTVLASQEDGVAIAAPQIGVSLRIFVISGKVFSLLQPNPKEQEHDIVCINPEIIKISKEKEFVEEGCLSVRYLYGKVKRSTKARIKALDENGNKFELGGSGILAQIFQHETDHLDGVLFTDKAVDVHDMPPQKPTYGSNKRKK